MKQLFLTIIAALLVSVSARGANTELCITLDDAVAMARSRSVEAAVALDRLRSAYWEWRTHRADQLPELTLNAKVPAYSNAYTPYMNAQGEYSFVRSRSLQASGQLAVTQNIALTGGRVSVLSSLDFMRQFDGQGNRYMTIPVAVTLEQPVFGTNSQRWQRRIEPERYREAKAEFISATEQVAINAVTCYFDLLLSRENTAIARQNVATAEKLYAVAVEKRQMGSISQNDLLQMEINLLDARAALTDCQSTERSDMFRLRTFLGIEGDVELLTIVPGVVPEAEVSYDLALQQATANNKLAASIRRRQLEAEFEVAKAKGDLRQINLFAQVGYTGMDASVNRAYGNLRGNQLVEVGVSVPLVDWGKRRGRVRVAESNRRVTESRLRQEALEFNQQLYVLVERFGNQRSQLDIASRTAELAARRYDTNVQTYMIGRISTLDLNDSQTRRDESRRQYIAALYKFWQYWYQLRSVTLYDFAAHAPINADIDRLVNKL